MPSITVHHDDPERTRWSEWRDVWYLNGEEPGTFILCIARGWWDNEKKGSSQTANEEVGEYKTESDVCKAMDEKVSWFLRKGWNHKRVDEYRYLHR